MGGQRQMEPLGIPQQDEHWIGRLGIGQKLLGVADKALQLCRRRNLERFIDLVLVKCPVKRSDCNWLRAGMGERIGHENVTSVRRHCQLVGLRLRWRAMRAACSWRCRSSDAGDLGPNLKCLDPGGSILDGWNLLTVGHRFLMAGSRVRPFVEISRW